jgi:glycerophosphoryl diester phosphodiesterase
MKRGHKVLVIVCLSLIWLIASLAIYTLVLYPATSTFHEDFFTGGEQIRTELILGAHRGDSVSHIENTLQAFNSAVKNESYHFIEFDLQYTADKVIVVHHDLSLLRLQKKRQKIQDLTYNELSNISEYPIPTYKEVMEVVANKKPLNIEIKSQGNLSEDIELTDFLIEDLEKRDLTKSTLISSISQDLILYINSRYNNYSTNYEEDSEIDRNYLNKNKYIDTGVIFYVKEDIFLFNLRKICSLIPKCYNQYDNMANSLETTGANYLMIHGANSKMYKFLYYDIPYGSKVVFWTFDDKMYLIMPEKYPEEGDEKLDELKPVLAWWEE